MRWLAALLVLCGCDSRIPEPPRKPFDLNEHILNQSDTFILLADGKELVISREKARELVSSSRWGFDETSGVPLNVVVSKAYRW